MVEVYEGKVFLIACGTKAPERARELAAELLAAADEAEAVMSDSSSLV